MGKILILSIFAVLVLSVLSFLITGHHATTLTFSGKALCQVAPFFETWNKATSTCTVAGLAINFASATSSPSWCAAAQANLDKLSSGATNAYLRFCTNQIPPSKFVATQSSTLVSTPPITKINSDSAGTSGQAWTQSEVSMDSCGPHIVAGYNDDQPATNSDGFSQSQNNGTTWTDGGEVPENSNDTNLGDPSVKADSNCNFYYASLAVNNTDTKVVVAKSTDGGMTFSVPVTVDDANQTAGYFLDKEMIAVGPNPAGGPDVIHITYTRFTSTHFMEIVYKRSLDGGATWVDSFTFNSGGHASGSLPVVDVTGKNVYVFYEDFDSGTTKVFKNNNSGASGSWSAGTDVARIGQITTQVNCGKGTEVKMEAVWNGNHRTNVSPTAAVNPVNGQVYVAWNNSTDGMTSKIVFMKSTNGGATWSGPKTFSPIPGRDQFEPWMDVSPNGEIKMIWYDRTFDPNNLLMDLFASSSSDGGNTWQSNQKVTPTSFSMGTLTPSPDPDIANCYFVGEYQGLDYPSNNATYTAWSDGRILSSDGKPQPDVFFSQIKKVSSLSKTANVTFGVAPLPVRYTYKETNIGNLTLSNVKVSDDSCTPVIPSSVATIAPGATATFTCVTTLAAPGKVINIATATGTLPNGSQAPVETTNAAVTVLTAHTTLTKTAQPSSGLAPLQVKYSYLEKNDGTAPIYNIVVSDNKCSPVTGGTKSLNPGQSATFTCTTVLNTNTTDTANATGTSLNGAKAPVETAQATVTVFTPDTTLSKTANVTSGVAPLPVKYTYIETNTGTATISNTSVSDDKCSPVMPSSVATLAPGDKATFTCVTKLSTPGTVTNIATATGTLSGGTQAPVETANATITVLTAQTTLTKTANVISGFAPLPVKYTYTETNTGTATISNVAVSDDKCSPVMPSSFATLDPGDTTTFTCTTTLTNPGSVTNTATASGTLPDGAKAPVETAQATVTVFQTGTTFTLSDQASCQAAPFNGIWNDTTFTCKVSGFTIDSGDTAVISPGVTLNNTGTITVNDGATFDNKGGFVNFGPLAHLAIPTTISKPTTLIGAGAVNMSSTTINSDGNFIIGPSTTLSINSGVDLVIDDGGTLTANLGGGIHNSGTITVNDGATFANKGGFENSGTLSIPTTISKPTTLIGAGNVTISSTTINSGGNFVIGAFTTLLINSGVDLVINDGGTLTTPFVNNQGTINSTGTITVNDGATLDACCRFTNNGTLAIPTTISKPTTLIGAGKVTISSTTINSGGNFVIGIGTTLSINSGVDLVINDGGTITNSYTITNSGGTITNKDGGTITFDGTIENGGTNNSGGTIINAGNITGPGAIINGGTFNSGGTITNSGIIAINGGDLENGGVNNSPGLITNKGNITFNNGLMENGGSGGIITNSGGTIINSGSITSKNRSSIVNSCDTTCLNSSGTITNNSGGTITNDAGAIFDNSDGTITNSGTITNNSVFFFNGGGVTLTGHSTIVDRGGTITNLSGGTITNNSGGTILNVGNSTSPGIITNDGIITNSGTIENGMSFFSNVIISNNSVGIITNDIGGTIENNGTIRNGGAKENSVNTFSNNNFGTITNSGTINNGGSIINGGSSTSPGTITNTGGITNLSGGTIINGGNSTSPGTIINSGGTIANLSGGTITNGGNSASPGTITNTGSINNGGSITNGGNSTSPGTITNAAIITNNLGGIITNGGTNSGGTMTNNFGGTISNSGTIANGGNSTSPGIITNYDTITNSGKINNGGNNNSGGTITNSNFGTITNSGTIKNGGNNTSPGIITDTATITNNFGGTIKNGGANNSTGTITINSGGSLTNDINSTISNNGILNLDAGDTILFNGPSTYSGSFSNSGTFTMKSASIVSLGSGTRLFLNSGTLSIPTGVELDVGSTSTVTINVSSTLSDAGTITNTGTMTNNFGGTMTIKSGGSINNGGNSTSPGTITSAGKITDSGTINNGGTNNSGGTITNDVGSTLTINSGGIIANGGQNKSPGTITDIAGSKITINFGGTINNGGNGTSAGIITNAGKLTNLGTINNGGNNTSWGTITNIRIAKVSNSGVIIINSTGIINNGGQNNSNGTITNNSTASITNNGAITNNKSGTITNAGTINNNAIGNITNNGTIKDLCGGIINGNPVSGNPVINACNVVSCPNPPISGDWIISSSCTISSTTGAPANVIVQSHTVVTIPNGVRLNIDLTHFHLLVKSGGKVLIKAGGSIN